MRLGSDDLRRGRRLPNCLSSRPSIFLPHFFVSRQRGGAAAVEVDAGDTLDRSPTGGGGGTGSASGNYRTSLKAAQLK